MGKESLHPLRASLGKGTRGRDDEKGLSGNGNNSKAIRVRSEQSVREIRQHRHTARNKKGRGNIPPETLSHMPPDRLAFSASPDGTGLRHDTTPVSHCGVNL